MRLPERPLSMSASSLAPPEVVDPLLWREARLMMARHAEAGYDGRYPCCGHRWPCPPRMLAERAQALACRPPVTEPRSARRRQLRAVPESEPAGFETDRPGPDLPPRWRHAA